MCSVVMVALLYPPSFAVFPQSRGNSDAINQSNLRNLWAYIITFYDHLQFLWLVTAFKGCVLLNIRGLFAVFFSSLDRFLRRQWPLTLEFECSLYVVETSAIKDQLGQLLNLDCGNTLV